MPAANGSSRPRSARRTAGPAPPRSRRRRSSPGRSSAGSRSTAPRCGRGRGTRAPQDLGVAVEHVPHQRRAPARRAADEEGRWPRTRAGSAAAASRIAERAQIGGGQEPAVDQQSTPPRRRRGAAAASRQAEARRSADFRKDLDRPRRPTKKDALPGRARAERAGQLSVRARRGAAAHRRRGGAAPRLRSARHPLPPARGLCYQGQKPRGAPGNGVGRRCPPERAVREAASKNSALTRSRRLYQHHHGPEELVEAGHKISSASTRLLPAGKLVLQRPPHPSPRSSPRTCAAWRSRISPASTRSCASPSSPDDPWAEDEPGPPHRR